QRREGKAIDRVVDEKDRVTRIERVLEERRQQLPLPLRVRLPPPHLRHACPLHEAESWVTLLTRSVTRDGGAGRRGRRRSAYEAPNGSVAPGAVSSGAESKRRRCPRSRARQSRVTLLARNSHRAPSLPARAAHPRRRVGLRRAGKPVSKTRGAE